MDGLVLGHLTSIFQQEYGVEECSWTVSEDWEWVIHNLLEGNVPSGVREAVNETWNRTDAYLIQM